MWRDWCCSSRPGADGVVVRLLRADVAWRPVSLLVGAALPFAVLWRRTHPLAMVRSAFGVISWSTSPLIVFADQVVGLDPMAVFVLIPASFVRWERPGRRDRMGFIVVGSVVGIVLDYNGIGDSSAGSS